MAPRSRLPKDRERYFIDNTFLRGGWGAKLGPYAIAVYNAIALHADSETQEAWPSHGTIAKLTGMSPRQVIREVERLESYNIVYVVSRQAERKPPIVTLLDKSVWKPIEHMTPSHMTDSLMTGSHKSSDSESDEHMTPSHTNKTQETELINKDAAPDYLAAVFNGQGQSSEVTASNPDDQWFSYRDKALKAFPGEWGKTPKEREIKKNLILGFVADTPDFRPDHWSFIIQDCIAHGVSSNNITRFIEVYSYPTYESYLAGKYPASTNGRDSPVGLSQGRVTAPITSRTNDKGFNL